MEVNADEDKYGKVVQHYPLSLSKQLLCEFSNPKKRKRILLTALKSGDKESLTL